MDDPDDSLLDIFAPVAEPPLRGGGRLAWGAVAGAVVFAGLPVAAAVQGLAPARDGAGAAWPGPAAPAPVPPIAAAQRLDRAVPAPGPAAATPADSRGDAPLAEPALAGLPASWRAGVPFVFTSAVLLAGAASWVLLEAQLAPDLSGSDPEPRLAMPVESAPWRPAAVPEAVADRLRPASARGHGGAAAGEDFQNRRPLPQSRGDGADRGRRVPDGFGLHAGGVRRVNARPASMPLGAPRRRCRPKQESLDR